MSGVSYLELLKLAAPETILVVTALVVLAADLLALRESGAAVPASAIGAMIACAGLRGGDGLDAGAAAARRASLRRHAGGGSA